MQLDKKSKAAVLLERMENGEICPICHSEYAEDYGEPKACEDCGGDGVIAKKHGVQ